MPFTPIETTAIIECLENFIDRLRPEDEDIKKKLDYSYTIEELSVYINEVRPQWDNPEILQEHAFAKSYLRQKQRSLEDILDARKSKVASL